MKNKPAPLLNPATKQPVTAEELGHVFCDELVKQELDDTTPQIPIPTEVFDFYKMYRPSASPLRPSKPYATLTLRRLSSTVVVSPSTSAVASYHI